MRWIKDLRTRESRQTFYSSKEWRDMRNKILTEQPLCRECGSKGIITVATLVDHIIDIKKDGTLCLDENNLQPMCMQCHKDKTVREENENRKNKKTFELYNRKWNIKDLLRE